MAFRMRRFVCNAATTAAATVENIDELCIGFVYEGEKIPQFSSTFFNAHCHFFLLRNSKTKAIKSAKKERERKKTVIGDVNECNFTQWNYGGGWMCRFLCTLEC